MSSSKDGLKVLFVFDIDHTLKLHNTARDTPPVEGMPELVASWCSTFTTPPPTIRYVTNRWGPLGMVGLGPDSFIRKHFPPGEIHQRAWYDMVGWLSRSCHHKISSLERVFATPSVPSPLDVVILLGDDIDFDAEVYFDAIRKRVVVGTVVIVGIRKVSGNLLQKTEEDRSQTKWSRLVSGLPGGVKSILYKDANELKAFVARELNLS
eukprot:PhF_6_TR18584/c0_g1_i1/m.27149